MRNLTKKIIFPSIMCLTILFNLSVHILDADALAIRVSQESTAGAGDFDSNVLGYINVFETALTASQYYNYGAASYNGPAPATVADQSQMFLVDASDGLSLFVVHDKRNDGDGGRAYMSIDLMGDTAAFVVGDDTGEGLSSAIGVQTNTFTTRHTWLDCCTDGFAIGSLDNDWSLTAAFTFLGVYDQGQLTSWAATSSNGSQIALNMNLNQKVRLDAAAPVPEPSTVLFYSIGIVGLALYRKRKV